MDVNRNVQFLGYVKDPFKFYSKIDVALICSKNEGMGRVTAEAMVASKVIIGLDNAGTSELIGDKTTGLLYDGSIGSLVSEMEYTLKNSCQRLAINAQNNGFNKFLIENYAQKIQVIIESV